MSTNNLLVAYDADKVINTPMAKKAFKKGAAIDAAIRNRDAIANVPLFSDPTHLNKIEQVKKIAEGIFAVHSGVYVNHRENGSNPFSVVKFVKPQMAAVSPRTKDNKFRKPLKALGVEIVYSRRSKSYLFRVR